VSGRPKPGRGDEAEQLRELLRDAHGMIRDLRAEIRTSRELIAEGKLAFGAALQAHYDETHAAVQASADRLREALDQREADFILRLSASLPVRTSCSWCGAMLTGLIDVTKDELVRTCPECGEETRIQLVETSKRIRLQRFLAEMDRRLDQVMAAGADPGPIAADAYEASEVPGTPPVRTELPWPR
jgi:hypothetical protein